jgi:hypothetical protein
MHVEDGRELTGRLASSPCVDRHGRKRHQMKQVGERCFCSSGDPGRLLSSWTPRRGTSRRMQLRDLCPWVARRSTPTCRDSCEKKHSTTRRPWRLRRSYSVCLFVMLYCCFAWGVEAAWKWIERGERELGILVYMRLHSGMGCSVKASGLVWGRLTIGRGQKRVANNHQGLTFSSYILLYIPCMLRIISSIDPFFLSWNTK